MKAPDGRRWKNKTAGERDRSASLTSPSGKSDDFKIQYVAPEKTTVLEAEDHGHLSTIKPGESVYLRLKSMTGDYRTTSKATMISLILLKK
ncbi:hypothetical protein [Bacillus tequilensis]|uniref:hypothetical protein n=1 Tax=Bacillus tequilensis TaxID=227866 RepID=UPI001F0D6B3A|nr:hypothetical protein [Bacillus tequilensis]